MDLELKEFEDKINNITEQFMSLLDSNDVIESSVNHKLEDTVKVFDGQSDNKAVAFGGISNDVTTFENSPVFKLGAEDIKVGGIPYGAPRKTEYSKYAVKFDTVEQMDLNKRLESLYETKRKNNTSILDPKSSIAFSDSNIGNWNRFYANDEFSEIQTDSTKNKEVYEMTNCSEEGKKENGVYSFATIPAEKSLTEKKNWKDILFMDIPWDTKIDIWGGIKKFCNAQVKITF